MKIAVIGSGGREHAIGWRLSKENSHKLYSVPGNGGTKEITENVDVSSNKKILEFLKENEIEMVIIGPEIPLAEGLADETRKSGIITLGPNKDGARIEKSKVWAKNFMNKYNIPTADHIVFDDYDSAIKYVEKVREDRYPLVVKADGLAAGKGVFIVKDTEEARDALNTIMVEKKFGEAGKKVEIEEFLRGVEASYLVFMDGEKYKPMVTSKDYKQLLDNDRGPNTGGMGTFSPSPHIDRALEQKIQQNIIDRVLEGFHKENIDYRGVLYAGLMLTEDGPKVLEFNCRFGDPETQVILPRLKTPLSEIVHAINEVSLEKIDIKWKDKAAVCVIAASDGYPIEYEKGKHITGLENVKKSLVFHAGTKFVNEKYYTAGGRVLGVTAVENNLRKSREQAYRDISKITFEGMYYRNDIAKL
ncbi:MAG: phosphoribosylamine--glycine ligase [Candidatus Mcinerneyibacterium aminivorans]|uniref:Phosphoribosylamine--glycine ligase n=1 Tax=Candidatus Mcinerneyibacterium aminivorans TaxID=2703815 RepID=A0A5D0MG14_9BACT|nr:MAG: phosphoribosylamine--glycine ligase [Candidatus Mcinerneyibacterium aminivorans]